MLWIRMRLQHLLPVLFQVYVLKRPHVDEFLKRMGELFECVLFTASLSKVRRPVWGFAVDVTVDWGRTAGLQQAGWNSCFTTVKKNVTPFFPNVMFRIPGVVTQLLVSVVYTLVPELNVVRSHKYSVTHAATQLQRPVPSKCNRNVHRHTETTAVHNRCFTILYVTMYCIWCCQYADPVSDLLDKWGAFRTRLFRESCVFHRGNYVKDLSRLGRDLNKVIILDNSPASYIFHPDNAVRYLLLNNTIRIIFLVTWWN